MEKLVRLIIFSLLIASFAKCDGSKADISRVLDELKDIVGQLDTDNQKKTEEGDSAAKADAELLDELEFEAEIQKLIQKGKSQDKGSVNNKDGIEFDDELNFEADIEREIKNDKKASCRNLKKGCFQEYLNKRCTEEGVRKDCPRTCMKCCADISPKICKSLRKYCFREGFTRKRMRNLCPKTCSYCGKGLAPAPCITTVFGCCWDKSTPASAPIGSGREKCPECMDKKSPLLCSRFKHYCNDFNPDHKAGRQIRSFCPRTCRVCGPNAICRDHDAQKENCPLYKNAGDCELNKNGMRYWCPKTCGFCKSPRQNPASKIAYL